MEFLGETLGKDGYQKPVVEAFHDYCRKCDSLLQRGLYKGAEKLARQAMIFFPNAIRPYEHVGLAVTLDGQDTAAEIEAWRTCIDRFSDRARPNWFIKLQEAIEKGRGDIWQYNDPQRSDPEIEALYAEARQIWPEEWGDLPPNNPDNASKKELALTVSEWIAYGRANAAMKYEIDQDALAAWERYFAQFADRAALPAFFSYVVALDSCSPPDGESRVTDLLKAAQTRWPLENLKQTPTDEQAVQQQQLAAQLCLFMGRRLLAKNQVAEANAFFARIPKTLQASHVADQLGQISDSLAMLTAYQDLFGAEIDFSNRRSILPWRSPTDSKKVVFVFGGAQFDNLNLAMSNIHLALRDKGCHLVYLADQNESFYLTGGDWSGPDELCTKLRAVAAFLGAEQFYTLGNSSGGYAAIRYGAALGVEAVLAFSPVTSPLKAAVGGSRKALKAIQRSFPDLPVNLSDYLGDHRPLPRTKIAFGEACTVDRTAAESLRKEAAVTFEVAPGFASHGALRWFIAKDKLSGLVEELLKSSQPSRDF